MLLDRQHIDRIELAVHVGVEQEGRLGWRGRTWRGGGHGSPFPTVSTNLARARASRDITVPIGTPVTSAISR